MKMAKQKRLSEQRFCITFKQVPARVTAESPSSHLWRHIRLLRVNISRPKYTRNGRHQGPNHNLLDSASYSSFLSETRCSPTARRGRFDSRFSISTPLMKRRC